jgi:hypothetical protein
MNTNTVFIMFAVIAAFGLATAMVVIPLADQAQAQQRPPNAASQCHNSFAGQAIGTCAHAANPPPT